jgi:hypothetical protein
MDNNIPELKQSIWKLVEAISELTGHTKAGIVRQLTTTEVHPNGRDFDELKSKWNLCRLRTQLDNKFIELGYNIYEWYRTGEIVKIPEQPMPNYSAFVSSVGEGIPPRKADGSYDTWGS